MKGAVVRVLAAQTRRSGRDGSMLAQGKINHEGLGGLPKIKERKTVITTGLPLLLCSKPEAFAKPPEKIVLRRKALYLPPFQPWTWPQLATIFCFTSAGNGT